MRQLNKMPTIFVSSPFSANASRFLGCLRRPIWLCVRKNFVSASEAGQKAFQLRQAAEEKIKRNSSKSVALDTILAHAGIKSDPESGNAPLSSKLEMATTFERPPSGHYPEDGPIYSRSCNPTRKLLESEMYRLETYGMSEDIEGKGSCTAYSSGMAAVSSILLACPNSHIILADDCYHGVPTQLVTVLNQHGISHTPVDMTHLRSLEEKITGICERKENGVVIIWIETPSNPLAKVTDIKALCNRIKDLESRCSTRLFTVVDSTWAPPSITQPLALGADAVIHSATKYLGGHSDLTLGLVTTSPLTKNGQYLGQKLLDIQSSVGAVASPFDAWLCLRGMRTLSVRLVRQCSSAMDLAAHLSEHPLVQKVHYPGLTSHPQHKVATQQMNNIFGGMLSFEVKDEVTAMAVAGALNIIKRATSLGGTETLIEHRASIEPIDRVTSPPGLLRVSVGLEDPTDLKRDLDTALKVAQQVVVD